jgi:hypothetical protein
MTRVMLQVRLAVIWRAMKLLNASTRWSDDGERCSRACPARAALTIMVRRACEEVHSARDFYEMSIAPTALRLEIDS